MQTRVGCFIFLVVVVVLFSACSCAAEAPTTKAQAIAIARVVRVKGWDIPGLSNARVSTPRKAVEVADRPQLEVYETVLTLPKPKTPDDLALADLPFYYVQMDNSTLKIRERAVRVDSIRKYDYKGKVFCYDVMTTQYNEDQSSGRGGLGPAWNVRYYDMDGDGRFETMEAITTAIPIRPPDWAGGIGQAP